LAHRQCEALSGSRTYPIAGCECEGV
jgi:hypothetical protein